MYTKKIICLVFILLTSCVPAPASQPSVLASSSLDSVSSSFVYSEKCPYVCWLGISPGKTTAEEALKLLRSSDQIDQDSYIGKNETGLRVEWHTEQMGAHSTSVGMIFENGVVNKINFSFPSTVKIREFIDLIGMPDEISVEKDQTIEAACCIAYIVYYTSAKALMFAYAPVIDGNGPNEEDSINTLYLNMSADDPNGPQRLLDHKDLRQPWLGFRHLEEYLKNRPSSSE